jgi:hypothetical protein
MALLVLPRLGHGGNPIRLPIGRWHHNNVVPFLEPLLWLFGVHIASDGVVVWSTLVLGGSLLLFVSRVLIAMVGVVSSIV